MRFTDLLRNVADSLDDHHPDMIGSLLLTAADNIDNQNIYKLKWAEIAEKYAKLEKENETLLDELKTHRKTKDDH